MKYYSEETVKGLLEQMDSHFVKYLEDLPSIEIKEPHGRLGDLDKVAGRMHNHSKSCRENGNREKAEIWEHAEQEVRLQGTVIEASEERK